MGAGDGQGTQGGLVAPYLIKIWWNWEVFSRRKRYRGLGEVRDSIYTGERRNEMGLPWSSHEAATAFNRPSPTSLSEVVDFECPMVLSLISGNHKKKNV